MGKHLIGDFKTRFVYIKSSYSVEAYNLYYSLTTDIEKWYLNRYKDFKNRYDSLLGLILTKMLVYGEVDTSHNLLHKSNGQPYLEGYQGYVSIAHSSGYVVSFVSGSKVGVDIEELLTGVDRELFLSPSEMSQLSKTGRVEQELTTLWTLKEAYVKCTNTGFLTNPTDIEFKKVNNVWVIDKYETKTFTDLTESRLTLSLVTEGKTDIYIEEWRDIDLLKEYQKR